MNEKSQSASYETLQNYEKTTKSTKEETVSIKHSPGLSPETLLGDISFLNQFKDKMIANSKDNPTVTKKEVGGRYSLIDRDLQSVDKASHVITELWKLPAEKSLNCLMGQMESCEDDVVIGDETDASRAFSSQYHIVKPVVKAGKSY